MKLRRNLTVVMLGIGITSALAQANNSILQIKEEGKTEFVPPQIRN